MIALHTSFPHSVRVGGEIYSINTDFKTCLKVILAYEDVELASHEKQAIMLTLIYGDIIPPNTKEALEKAQLFLDCGETEKGEGTGVRCYSFSKDAQAIYSAFLQTYNVDLQTADLHWWKFVSMFQDLDTECAFTQMVSLRLRHARGKLSKEEKTIWARNRDKYELECDDFETKKAKESFMNLLKGGGEDGS